MMNVQLTVPSLLERAEKFYSKKQVVSRTHSGIHRFTYKQIGERTRKLAHALEKLGVQKGERVATLAWNHHRHLEAYFAAPGIGAVLHTINLRLSPEHIAFIINHAEDKVLLVDEDLFPLVEKMHHLFKTVKAYIVMTDKATLPDSSIEALYSYEELLAESNPSYQFAKDIDENAPAGMCYTSATTGKPKGVVYSHRAIVLHCFALGLADTTAISEKDIALPVVPMFHVNAWGLPFAATWFGTTQVMPGPQFTPQIIAQLIQDEKVTITAGVPTIWMALLNELEKGNYNTSSLRGVLCGGSAAPKVIIEAFEKKYNIPFLHAYGMTETTPLVTISTVKSYQDGDLTEGERFDLRAKQGLLVPGLEMKVVGASGEVEWNDTDMGELLLRGPWIANEYYKDERTDEAFRDGWLHTGDVVTIDEEGNMKIVDRTKDLIKSGGEWISSVDLENAIMSHEGVFEACVVAVPDPKWQERPIACVVLKEKYRDQVTKEDILTHITPHFAKWELPDDVLFIEEIPKTSVGKFLKATLRKQVKEIIGIV